MTYSIVARDPVTGDLGVAVQSCWFSVGSVVTWARAGVGAVATQSFAEPAYGARGLALMDLGVAASTALQALLSADPLASRRQVAFVDAHGAVAQHTGEGCIAEAGHTAADGVAAQANMMRSDAVWPAMLQGFAASSGELADRLLAALDAAEDAGGDVRGRQSAALLVVSGERSSQPWHEPLLDLGVDDAAEPLAELRRLLSVQRAYGHMERGERLGLGGEPAAALREYEAARRLAPGNREADFWTAIFLAADGRAEEGRRLMTALCEADEGWAELLRRLPAVGLLPGGEAMARSLLLSLKKE